MTECRSLESIEQNEFQLIPGKIGYQRRPDRSTLITYDKGGKVFFSIKYMNKIVIRMTGTFGCSDGTKVMATETKTTISAAGKPDLPIDGICLIGSGGFVATSEGFRMGPPLPGALIRNPDGTISRVPADGRLFGLPPLKQQK